MATLHSIFGANIILTYTVNHGTSIQFSSLSYSICQINYFNERLLHKQFDRFSRTMGFINKNLLTSNKFTFKTSTNYDFVGVFKKIVSMLANFY